MKFRSISSLSWHWPRGFLLSARSSSTTSFPELVVSLTFSCVGSSSGWLTGGAVTAAHICFCSAAPLAATGVPQSYRPEAEEMSLWASVCLAVGWLAGELLKVASSPEALPHASCVLGFCLMPSSYLHSGRADSVVQAISAVPAAGPPSCFISKYFCGHPLCWSHVLCALSTPVVVAQNVFRLTLFLLQECFVLSYCLNYTWLFFFPKLLCKLLPLNKWMGNATFHSSSHLFLLHLLLRARQQSSGLCCGLCWRNDTVFAGADWYSHGRTADVSSGTVWNSQHCSWGWWLADGRRSYWIIIWEVFCDCDTLQLLSASLLLWRFWPLGLRELRVWGVFPHLLSSGWRRCACVLHVLLQEQKQTLCHQFW